MYYVHIDMASALIAGPGASNSTITIADARARNTGKLRQTCDPCSEAKVKCDKGNPRCSRCDRLAYNCVYSPARRIGRPRPYPRRSTYQDGGDRTARDTGEDGTAVTPEAANKDYTGSVEAQTTVPAPPPRDPVPVQSAQQQTPRARPLDLHLAELPPARISYENHGSAPASGGASASARAGSIDRNSTRDGSFGNSIEQSSLVSIDEVRQHPYEYDCATVALATLSRLAAAGPDGQQSGTPGTTHTVAAADVLTDQVPHACRQAARILVCPCSTDMDTALLAASLAAAILDVADAALRTLKPAGRALDDEQHTVLALDTLPKISQVVTLFTHRYRVNKAGRPPEALPLLAASLRTTLKTIAEEMTSRFLDKGAAPSLR